MRFSSTQQPFFLSSRSSTWVLAFAFWSLLGASYALSAWWSSQSEGTPISWAHAFARNLPSYYLWMLFTPLVQWICRWANGRGVTGSLLVHVPAGVLVSALHTVIYLEIYWRLRGPGQTIDSIGDLFRTDFVYEFHLGLLAYGVLVVVIQSLRTRQRLRDEQMRAAQLETQLAQSQLQALRMQLQPHFLFNTLNAISALTLQDPALARSMIVRLSEFMRLTLEEGATQNVPLARELQFLDSYLAIQQLRFQDRLSVELDVPAATLGASVPHLILQPIIENALRHGLSPKPGPGTLQLRVRHEGGRLHLRVDDDGLGLPPHGASENIGLGNTRSRLLARYGDDAQLQLLPRPGGGTRAELSLPYTEHAA